jgi:hypothetical protein
MQPVAGITDGTLYLQSSGLGGTPSGATRFAYFHEITNGGAGSNTFLKSCLSWSAAGQRLGTALFFGVNGHRIDDHGFLDINRSSGPRRGYLYFIFNRNPNAGNPTLDQGDVALAISTNGATSWSTATVPTAGGKTQFFPMLDVDDQGWIHVAYYQNETGSVNGGVLNASTVNLYYLLSTDGGSTWTTPTQVNAPANALDLPDPPPDRSAVSYYLLGDYAQLQAAGTGLGTKVYILWTGYDKDRTDASVGNKKERVLCTTLNGIAPVPQPVIFGSMRKGTNFIFSFASITGRTYQVQEKSSFALTNWQVSQSVPGNGTVNIVTNSISTPQRFYRLSVQ